MSKRRRPGDDGPDKSQQDGSMSPPSDEDQAQDGDEDEPTPTGPHRPIARLSESVVNRIAAGEIILRPANALKELIENSLDAGATLIRITLKDGGLKLLQIQDNGHGVRVDDLPLLCQRFATSKLRDFDDLTRMTTFGFRGEALASISFVSAQMAVVTKTQADKTAWRAFYKEGALTSQNNSATSSSSATGPKPCAGTDGTTITAHDLFFNVPQRRRALKSAAEEYNRALDVVGKYALHYGSRGVGFVCKKASSNTTDLSTPSSPSTTTLDTIRLLYGSTIARELLHVAPTSRHSTLGFSFSGYLSNANYSSKQRTTFLCFINNRLVDCSILKRSLEAFYSTLLPKGSHPWIYLALDIDPQRVDVNVHPTKKEVHFLEEEEVVEEVIRIVSETLSDANRSRSFNLTQAILPGAGAVQPPQVSQASSSSQAYPQHQVRVDARVRTLDSMLRQDAAVISSDGIEDGSDDVMTERAPTWSSLAIPLSPCTLTSIRNLRAHITASTHGGLLDILQSHTFVGVVDLPRALSLIQHGTRLYLVNHDAVIEEFVYQATLRQFGSLKKVAVQGIDAESPLDVEELILLAIHESGQESTARSKTNKLTPEAIAHRIANHLASMSEMLSEYFSLHLERQRLDDNTERICLTHLPSILPTAKNSQFLMPTSNLPMFLLRLGTQVDWSGEGECFDGFARELSYAHRIAHAPSSEEARWKHTIQNTWFPLFGAARKNGFCPGRHLVKDSGGDAGGDVDEEGPAVIQLAALSDLYRIFERC